MLNNFYRAEQDGESTAAAAATAKPKVAYVYLNIDIIRYKCVVAAYSYNNTIAECTKFSSNDDENRKSSLHAMHV